MAENTKSTERKKGLLRMFQLIKSRFATKSDLADAERTFSTALNGIDVLAREHVDAQLADIEQTLAAAWDDLDRRLQSLEYK